MHESISELIQYHYGGCQSIAYESKCNSAYIFVFESTILSFPFLEKGYLLSYSSLYSRSRWPVDLLCDDSVFYYADC